MREIDVVVHKQKLCTDEEEEEKEEETSWVKTQKTIQLAVNG